MAEKLYFEDVKEGDESKPLVTGPITRTQIVKYAGASGDFVPLHTDELFAIRAGFDRVFAMGKMGAGMCTRMICDWLGYQNIKKYAFRFTNQVWPNDVITYKGKVVRKFQEGEANLVECEVWGENQHGARTLMGSVLANLPSKR
ncbi:MAG: hypothetical protein HY730_06815 [Candidatus Tectomicrobia bacterium]|uniref:MaoC-like domain-containing protein n=1 Tax=Tectimicrobiota bacterium TaxID=2528274 RepID=A0A933GNN0_UNCTE|nr:hypothetical protein [Candidatus Tectomicrobia bacterium]